MLRVVSSMSIFGGKYGLCSKSNKHLRVCAINSLRYFSNTKGGRIEDFDTSSAGIDKILRSFDTTLTPEQQAHANMWKKKIKGGHLSPKCKFELKFSSPSELS